MDSNSEELVCWYHENLSREDADRLLKAESTTNGTFLVRESSTSPGDYVLSVLYDNRVIHYQIRKHEEDAFFSIDDETTIHGLDTLIEYYQEEDRGLGTKLTVHCRGTHPPHDTRRHGCTNLLHRATIQRNYTVVSELLKCGYRSLEAKNEYGQTAVHLAARDGINDILEKLIQNKASVNCRDTAGYTPLHYACQSNLPKTVEILIAGGGNVQARHTETGIVPLHEAAKAGNFEVIQVLISANAPVNPRTMDDEIPADLAEKNNHHECASFLRSYQVQPSKESRTNWYHGTLDRWEANALLEKRGNIDGSFLVRMSDRHNGTHVLTVTYHRQFYHFQIKNKADFLYIDNGPYLSSLEHVIEYYRNMPDGLPGPLIHSIAPVPRPPLPDMPPSIFNGMNTLMKREKNISRSTISNGVAHATDTNHFISGENLIQGEVLGEGEFGAVYEGVYYSPCGQQLSVAIKILHESQNESTRNEFLKEAKLMMTLNHHCIIKLIGFSEGPPLLMVQELIRLGSMLAYLLEFPDKVSPDYELKIWASQIACGMNYLEELRLVHRDLAARNILLSSKHQAKISDFGLSRTFGCNDYYRATKGGKWPIKWYSPESYNYGTFTHASDVWSYGITLWEMYSYGEQPYGDRRGIDVIQLVEKGERLDKPIQCSDTVYEIMKNCWSYEPLDRPKFKQLFELFNNENEYVNLRELIPTNDIS